MIQIKDKIHINADQARYILERETSRFGICIDLERALDYQSHYIREMKTPLRQFKSMVGDSYIKHTQVKEVASVLVRRFNVPVYKISSSHNKESISIAQDVLKGLLNDDTISEDAKEFINVYMELSASSYNISYLDQYVSLPVATIESFENHRMVVARPTWEVLNTGRISAQKPSIQNLTSAFGDIITYPKGYILLRADSGQIEPRITYSKYIRDDLIVALIKLYNDAYFGQLHFVLMSEEEEQYYRDNLDELEKKDLDGSLRKKLKLFGLAGNYGGKLVDENQELANMYTYKIIRHPARIALEREVTEAVNKGQTTFTAAFGTEITPKKSSKYSDSEAWRRHLIRCGINNPIQGTASELMCESVYHSYNLIQSTSPDIHIAYYKHDEGAFYIPEKYSDLVDTFAGFLSYQVEGWIPIYSDSIIGKKGGTESVSVI